MLLSVTLIAVVGLLVLFAYRHIILPPSKHLTVRERALAAQAVELVQEQHPVIASAVFCTSVNYCNIHKKEMMGKMLIEIAAFVSAITSSSAAYHHSRGITEQEGRAVARQTIHHLATLYRQPRKVIAKTAALYCATIEQRSEAIALLVERALIHRPAQASVDHGKAEEGFDQILHTAIERVWDALIQGTVQDRAGQ